MRTDSTKEWADLLTRIVPEEPEVGLLRALLWDGEAARAEWSSWTKAIGDARRYFENDYLGRKGLLAFLAHRVSANQLDVGPDFATYARVAQVREELRSRIFIDALRAVQDAMDKAALDPVLINGAAYAFTVYAEPLVRHNHGIDLLVPPAQMAAAKHAVAAAGFRPERTAALPRLETYRHGSGLELTLRPQLFLAPHVRPAPTDFRRRCQEAAVGELRVRVLAPSDRLCHTLGEGALGPTRRNLRWACDAFLLLTRPNAFAFEPLISTAEELGTALPTALLLDFFRAQLGVGVPAGVIEELRARGAPRNTGQAQLLLSMALRSSATVDEFVKRARVGTLFSRVARFALFPSAEHIAYQQRPVTRWLLPWLYVARVARLALRPFRRLLKFRTVPS